MRVEWLYEARCEFRELLAYYRAAAGAEAARELSDRVLSAVEALADAPRAGVLRREGVLGRHGFRALLIGRCACIYRIEEDAVRVYHLTDAERGDLYQILGIVSPDTDREVRAMKNNVFLKSTLRQPVKTALLVLVAALITFAFVSRASEYLLIRQETDRLSAVYRTAGTLRSAAGDRWADTAEAVSYLEDNPRVRSVNTFHYTSAIMEEDFCNADVDGNSPSKYASDFYFYGTLYDWDYEAFYFTVDTVLAGHPEIVEVGDRVTLFKSSRQKTNAREYEAFCAQLERGGRYLAVGYYRPSAYPLCRVEDDGAQRTTYACLTRLREQTLFYPVAQGGEADWNSPLLRPTPEDPGYPTKDCIQYTHDIQRSLSIIPVRDMSALPAVQDAAAGIYLTDGRWLDSEDDQQGRKVCVINASFASMRDLAVGDALTLRLQDIPSFFGYRNNLEDISEDARVLRSAQTATDTYEIVGIYEYLRRYPGSSARNLTYLPASAVPETFQMTTRDNVWTELFEMYFFENIFTPDTTAFFPGEVSFVLRSPDDEAQFMAETRDDLARMGFDAVMTESGWDNFQAAAEPMRRSSLLSAAIFTLLLAAAVCLLAVIYYRMRRKDVAIARALGVPAMGCAWAVCLPLILTEAAGAALGGALGWRYALDSAGTILTRLGEVGTGEAAGLSGLWLAALLGLDLALLLAAAVGGSVYLSTRPVLLLIQGGASGGTGHEAEGPVAASVPAAAPRASVAAPAPRAPVPTAARPEAGQSVGHIFRFVWRHIARSRLKTALAVLLAAGFTVGLAAIRLSIASNQEKVDWLYENTSAEAELLLTDAVNSVQSGGFLRQDTIDALLDSGYVTDVYLEGSAHGAVICRALGAEDGQGVYAAQEDTIKKSFRAFADETVFLSPAGSGSAVDITYFDGWDGSLFAQDWAADEPFPVVLPKAVWERSGDEVSLACKGFRLCEVAGFYEGRTASVTGETDPVLMPLSAYRDIGSVRAVAYSKVHVTLDPSLNRELETFTQAVTDICARQSGMIALRAVIWDEELRLAVAPLENSVTLMEVLYPVTLVLSLLTAAGIAALFVMTSAKEAAILRVLGAGKLRSRAMLALQTALTSLAGLLLGLAGALAHTAWTRPELLAGLASASVLCAVLYLLAAIAGAVLSAVSVTARNPLELLQVRE